QPAGAGGPRLREGDRDRARRRPPLRGARHARPGGGTGGALVRPGIRARTRPRSEVAVSEALFENREDAGRRLAKRLRHIERERPVVLALPRGGVPVAFEIAARLRAPLDLL